MKVLIIGANGYLGSAITATLAPAGHDVVRAGRAREEAHAADFRVADLTDLTSLASAITPDIDAVVHAGAPTGDWDMDIRAIATMLDQLSGTDQRSATDRLAGTGPVFVYVSGAWALGPTRFAALDEQSPPRPISLVKGRETVEEIVLMSPVRGVVVRPGIVHGHGGGIPSLMTSWAREHGHGRYVIDGADPLTWPSVHVDDLAHLVRLALTEAAAGDILHAVAQEAVPVHDVARAAHRAAGGTGMATAWPLAEASDTLGAEFAQALATSQRVTSRRARQLGWNPEGTDLVSDVATGSY